MKPGLKELTGINEIGALADGEYAVPLATNFAAADAVVQPDVLLQKTVSAEHQVPLIKLKELAATLSSPRAQRYVPDKNRDKDPNRSVRGAVETRPTRMWPGHRATLLYLQRGFVWRAPGKATQRSGNLPQSRDCSRFVQTMT